MKHETRGIKLFKFLVLAILAACLIYGWGEYRKFTAVPTTRLAADSYYLEMPPDSHHHYLQLPIDHNDPAEISLIFMSSALTSNRVIM